MAGWVCDFQLAGDPFSPKASITGTGFLRVDLGPLIFSFHPQGFVTPERRPCFREQVTGGDVHRGGVPAPHYVLGSSRLRSEGQSN